MEPCAYCHDRGEFSCGCGKKFCREHYIDHGGGCDYTDQPKDPVPSLVGAFRVIDEREERLGINPNR